MNFDFLLQMESQQVCIRIWPPFALINQNSGFFMLFSKFRHAKNLKVQGFLCYFPIKLLIFVIYLL